MEQATCSFIKWRHAVQPRRQDVLGDFAGRELCAIHGEAMLMHCLTEAKVDFDGGFQLLHLVHAVESFLSKLQNRRCNFNVLWFDDHESLLLPGRNINEEDTVSEQEHAWSAVFQKRRLARAILIRHLEHYCRQTTPPMEICFRFTSMDSKEFDLYKKQRPVRLFFVSDGQTSTTQGGIGVMTFESIIYRLTTAGYTVGLIDDIEFKSSEVRATLFSARLGMQFNPTFWRPSSLPKTGLNTDPMLINQYQTLYEKATRGIKLEPLGSRDRTAVLALTMILRQDDSVDMQQRAAAFLVHLAILKHCPLSARPMEGNSDSTRDAAKFDRHFMGLFCDAGTAVLNFRQGIECKDTEAWDSYDLVDGRIWVAVRQMLPRIFLSGQSLTTFKSLEALVFETSGTALLDFILVPDASSPLPPLATNSSSAHHVGSLLPFSQPDFEYLLKDVVEAAINAEDKQEDESPSTFGSKPFKEDSHWHSTKKVSTQIGQASAPDAWAERKRRRKDQQRRTKMVAYAASLTNAVGKVLEPETIVVTKSAEPSGSSNAQKDKKTKPMKLQRGKSESKRGGIIQQREKQAQDVERGKAITAWGFTFDRLQHESDMLKRYRILSDYIARLSHAWRHFIGPDAHLFACCILGGQLSRGDNRLKPIGPDLKALIWRHLQDLRQLPLSGKVCQAAKMLSIRFELDIEFSMTSPASPPPTTEQADQPFLSEGMVTTLSEGLKRTKSPTLPKSTKFQLENCGPYMEKGFDSRADPRVSNFNPDAWQRDVLDTIDNRHSLIVVAPTSAGKTFISFYAMKQVLKESDDGVLVYVAPTKALCNQVAADVQARFKKSYPQMMGAKSVWAINTRDYRVNNSNNCQVLVTVPQMLQNLLLSPSSSGGSGKTPWTTRIKWIIFDEVHSIGQSEEGVVWEQLLLMAPCPVIALSATVGNPHELQLWLDGCEKEKGRQLRMIIHSARYSDLRCYYWTPLAEFKFGGFSPSGRWPVPGIGADGYSQDSPFEVIHPVATLVDRSRDTLDDISFESRDCLTLWESMNKHQSSEYPLDPALDPNVFFGDSAVVKAAVVKWETDLKKVLLHWLRHHDSPFLDVQTELSPTFGEFDQEERYGTKRTLQLLVDLQKRDAIPALIFLYDRTGCKESVRQIVALLGAFETQWKTTSPEWAKTMAAFEKYKKDASASRKKAAKPSKKSKKGKQDDNDDGDGPSSKLDSIREAASQGSNKWDSFDPDAPLDRFSLANYTKLSKSELEEYIQKMSYINLDDYIIEGLRRGVAVHHSGMNREYLQTVEILFRKGFLTAVVATGTLALGINMPCKTVVFSGDSTYLTALNYRQGAGRAGRRGFDILGNVVFYDFTPQRAKEIMSLRLSDLRGHFPISTSLVLRTSTLLHQTDRCEYSQQCLKSLFSQTRIYLGGPEGKEAIKHHLRFSIEYLRRHHLLSAKGAPINFSGLVSHLHYTENSIFAFHSLFEVGYFHSLCAGLQQDEQYVLNTLVLVLAHLFGRMSCRRYKDQAWLVHTVRPSSSVVLLPPLPAEAESILREHNASTLSIFRKYVQTYVRQHLSREPDDTLPFTHQKIAPVVSLDCHPSSRSRGGTPPVELRSPFAALSGFTDEFGSIRELCSTVRAGVFLEESSVPYMAVYPIDTDGVPLNAYIYDFFRHGDLKTLVKANGIKDGDVWYLLQDFELVLKTITASLANFIDPYSTAVDDLIMEEHSLSDEEDHDGDHMESAISSNTKGGTGTAASTLAVQEKTVSKKGKKVKVVDSWEDSESEGKEDGDYTPKLSLSVVSSAPVSQKSATPPEQGLKTVLLAFEKVRDQFGEKFHKIWA